MGTSVVVTGIGDRVLENFLRKGMEEANSSVVGLAIAYVSIYGVHFLRNISTAIRIKEIRLVADIGDFITHPQALKFSLEERWKVRVVIQGIGTFHPKLIIGGDRFSENGLLQGVRFSVIGSGNLTKGGLRNNIECSLLQADNNLAASARGFRELWGQGINLTQQLLEEYEIEFAERNRARSANDLKILGVADEWSGDEIEPSRLRQQRPPQPRERSIATSAAIAAWAGLESFTGEYRFQIEFPRDAGEVLGRIIEHRSVSEEIDVACEDGNVRRMRYRFYPDNAMFRLNVPNDTPGVDWARQNHSGVALVITSSSSHPPLSFKIVRPGAEEANVIGRSVALGTWGKTTTRLYGWF